MGVIPGAGGVVEGLVGEEVLIDGVEGWAAGVVQAVGIDLNCGVICQEVEGGVQVASHPFPLPFALIVFEKVWLAFGVVEKARGGDFFSAEAFRKRNGLAREGVRGAIGSRIPPAATFWTPIENKGDGGVVVSPDWVVGFVGEQIVKPLQSAH